MHNNDEEMLGAERKKFDGVAKEDAFSVLLTVVKQCPQCQSNTHESNIHAYMTNLRVPICEMHFAVVVDLDIEWNAESK